MRRYSRNQNRRGSSSQTRPYRPRPSQVWLAGESQAAWMSSRGRGGEAVRGGGCLTRGYAAVA